MTTTTRPRDGAPSRRALLAGAAAVAVPVAAVSAKPVPAAPDPAVIAWRAYRHAVRVWRSESRRADVIPRDPALDRASDAAWRDYEQAIDRLVAARPTTARGVLAKVRVAELEHRDSCDDWVAALLGSLAALDPATLAAG